MLQSLPRGDRGTIWFSQDATNPTYLHACWLQLYWNVTPREMVWKVVVMWGEEDFCNSYHCTVYHALAIKYPCDSVLAPELWRELKIDFKHAPIERANLWQKRNVKTNFMFGCLAVKNAEGLSFAQTCRTHLMAVLWVTWLSFGTGLQMHPTCLVPLNHDKVDFMRKTESTLPNTRGLQGHG